MFHPGNGGQPWCWGVPVKGFPMKSIISPPAKTQETELKTNFKLFSLNPFFLLLSLWKSQLNMHSLDWWHVGKLRGKQ